MSLSPLFSQLFLATDLGDSYRGPLNARPLFPAFLGLHFPFPVYPGTT